MLTVERCCRKDDSEDDTIYCLKPDGFGFYFRPKEPTDNFAYFYYFCVTGGRLAVAEGLQEVTNGKFSKQTSEWKPTVSRSSFRGDYLGAAKEFMAKKVEQESRGWSAKGLVVLNKAKSPSFFSLLNK